MVRLRSPAFGGIPERPKGADCKSVVTDFGGSNPPSPSEMKKAPTGAFFISPKVDSKGAAMNDVPGARQNRAPALSAERANPPKKENRERGFPLLPLRNGTLIRWK